MNDITAKTRESDGLVVRVHDDGHEEILHPRQVKRMTETSVEAAAMEDPDARPMTTQQIAAAPHVPKVKTVRRALSLSIEEFSARFQIPMATLQDWEHGRTEPDQPARAYLKVIASDPDAVLRALDVRPPT